MNYVNSDFLSGVNPFNRTNLSGAQQNALSALAPNGMGLQDAQSETPINLSIPTAPKIYPNGSWDAFGNPIDPNKPFYPTGSALNQSLSNPTTGTAAPNNQPPILGTVGGNRNFFNFLQNPGVNGNPNYIGSEISGNGLSAPNLNPTSQPQFNSFYPTESLIAERNYLMRAADPMVNTSLNARGIDNSGLGASMEQHLNNYIGTIAPDLTPANAQASDLARMYGWGVVNGLIKDQQLPGATPMTGAPTDPNQFIINNPGSPTGPQNPYTGAQYWEVAPGLPKWEVATYGTGQGSQGNFEQYYNPYAGPGYQYNTAGNPFGGAQSPIFLGGPPPVS